MKPFDDAPGPTFGQVLRGARLGWRWSASRGGFIRLSVDGDHVTIQLYPAELVPSPKRLSSTPYVCWWEDDGLLDSIVELRPVRRVKRPITFGVPLKRSV